MNGEFLRELLKCHIIICSILFLIVLDVALSCGPDRYENEKDYEYEQQQDRGYGNEDGNTDMTMNDNKNQ